MSRVRRYQNHRAGDGSQGGRRVSDIAPPFRAMLPWLRVGMPFYYYEPNAVRQHRAFGGWAYGKEPALDGDAAWSKQERGWAIDFTGGSADTGIDFGTADFLHPNDFQDTFTFVCHGILASKPGGYSMIIAKRDTFSISDMRFQWGFNTTAAEKWNFSNGDDFQETTPGPSLGEHVWAIVDDGTNLIIYEDGYQSGSTLTSMNFGTDGAAVMQIGREAPSGTEIFPGYIYSMSFFDIGLPQAAIKLLAQDPEGLYRLHRHQWFMSTSVFCDVDTNKRRGSHAQMAPFVLGPCADGSLTPLRDRRMLAWLYPGAAIVTGTKSLDLDALLELRDQLKTVNLDAALQKPDLTKTVNLNALVQAANLTVSTDLNALLKAIDVAKTTDLDAALQVPDQSKTVLLDAILAATVTITANLDALLKALDQTKTTDLDAILKKLDALKSLALDAAIQKADILRTVELDAALAVLNVTKVADLDAILKAFDVEKTVLLDALLKALDVPITANLDAALATLNVTKTTDLDAVLAALDVMKTASLDAALQELNLTASADLDAAIAALDVVKTTDLDAKLRALNVTKVADLDAALLTPDLSKTALFDAVLSVGVVCDAATNQRRGSYPQFHPMVLGPCPDGDLNNVLDRRQLNALYPTAVQTLTRTADLDALLQVLNITVVADLDALLLALDLTRTAELDALLRKQDVVVSTDLDAALQVQDITQFVNLDAALLAENQMVSSLLDAVLTGIGQFTRTTNLDALLQLLAATRTVDLDAILAFGLPPQGYKPSWTHSYGKHRMLSYIAPFRTNI